MKKQPRSVQVFDTPSGVGGSFTVSIIDEADERVTVRVWYGRATVHGWEAWKEWDGYTFATRRDALSNPRVMPLFNDRT